MFMKHGLITKILLALSIAGATAGSLLLLEHLKPHEAAAVPSGPANSTANHIHELTALKEQLKQNPNHAPILFRMAQLSNEMGKSGDAISYLRQLLKADASNLEARLELGRLLYADNDVSGAKAETEQILETDPKQVDALYNLGAINANLGKDGVAREYWTRAVASAPDSESGKRAKDGLQKLGPTVIQSRTADAEPRLTRP
jgi:tetratricopeptide (TPR) repeat protein